MRTLLLCTALTFMGCSHKPQIQGVNGMASQVPASALFFAGLDAREKMPSDFVQTLDKIKDKPELAGNMQNYKKQMGHDLLTALKAFEPAGWAIVVDSSGKKDYAMVAGIWMRDRKLAESCVNQSANNEPPVKTDNIDTYKKAGYSTCYSDPFLLISNKPEGIQAVLKRQGSLADDANYQAAHAQMFSNQALAFAYSAPPDLPKAIHYFAGGVGKTSPYRPVAFLSIDPAAKDLLTAPAHPNALAGNVPARWNFYTMMQLRYPLEVLAQHRPEALQEPGRALKEAGTSSAQVDKVFQGDLALGLDLDQYFAQIPQAPPNGLLMCGLRSGPDFEALWKTFCRGNGIKTSSARVGAYQVDRFTGMPYLVLARQGKQALLVMGKQPDEVLKQVAQLKPADSLAKTQTVAGVLFAVQYDLRNTRLQLAKSGLLALSPELAPLQAQMQNSAPELWQGEMNVHVEKDGIKAEGNPATMLAVGIIKAAVIATYLEF
ncbi:MAG: hypothetical protein KIS61_30635 [Candidatus Eremiobacteraeota bacterium]|nr:hypothetical protein [Candidatus Eremiobacteraeota bacterium]